MKKSLLAVAVAPLLSHAQISFAQDHQTDETMVVTANRFEQSQRSALSSISVITRDDIEVSRATTALDLIKTLPGVTVNPQGTKGNATGIYIRGTATKQALVILDGVRLNSPTAGEASIGLIPTFAIESIEIIRGPRAAVYGSDAMGGVISISTIKGQESTHELQVGVGDQGQRQLGWKSSGPISANTTGAFVFNKEQSDGYRIYDGAPENETHGYDSQTIFGNLKYNLSDSWGLSLSGFTKSSQADYANQFVIDAPSNSTEGDFYSLTGAVYYRTNDLLSEVQISSTKDHNADGDKAGTLAKSTLTGYRDSVSWVTTYVGFEPVIINTGIDYATERASRGGTNTSDYEETNRDNKAAFLTLFGELGRFSTEASIRRDYDSAFGGHNTWNLALGYLLADQFQFVASSGTAFNAPTFNDLYWPGQGNPNLKAEESQSTEIGVYGYHQWFDWSLAAYHSQFKNLIEWGLSDSGTYLPQNIAEAEIEGIEAGLEISTGVVNHKIGAEWLTAKDKKSDKDLIRRPQHKFSWTPTMSFEKVDASLAVLYVGERFASTGEYLSAYTTVDLGVGVYTTDQLTLGLRVNNLFDEEYQTAAASVFGTGEKLYYRGAERNILATLNYQF